MSRTEAEFRNVKALSEAGLSDYEIAAVTGVSRPTVQRWRHRAAPPGARTAPSDPAAWRVPDPAQYSYLLGCYLGDGHVIHHSPNGWTLRIACDQQYEGIIDEVLRSMAITFPGRRPTRFAAAAGASAVVTISHQAIARAFPQHGPGPKHLRPIVLADWQRALTREHPDRLIRGLIHSDGCRTTNRFRTQLPSGRVGTYSYTRYFFSNLSDDIRAIFIEHCQMLGIRVTQPNQRNLAVSHRDSVAILDSFVGPKH